MSYRAGYVLRLATPIRAWAQRFALLLVIGATFGLMLLGKADSLVVERMRIHLVDAITPILEVASQPVQTVDDALERLRHMAELQQMNSALRQENARLAAWHHRARQLEAENAALRDLLNLVPEPGKRFVTARVIGDPGGAFARSVLVAAGSQDGIVKGQAALAGEGLAGRVAEVGERATRVLLITDINSRIPVVVGQGRDRAVLAGDNSPRPALRYLAPGSVVQPGDRVVTSGHGGVLPSGLPVGVVAEVGDQGVRIAPYVDWTRLEFLRLVDYELPGMLSTLPGEGGGAWGR